jgi:MoxR-like ATPase
MGSVVGSLGVNGAGVQRVVSNDHSSAILGKNERISFYGVPLELGSGGDLVPNKERFKDDVITPFDAKLMRDIGIAIDLNHPLLIEGGADLGKTQAVDRVCGLTNREVYFVNCRDMEAEMLIGRMTAVEGTKSGFGWKDGIVIQAIRNGGVLVLDEYNRLKSEARSAFHQVYDAVLRNKGEVILTENNGERVTIHPNFRMIMTQNPPDGTYTNREVIDPAEASRMVHLRYPAQLPAEVEEARILGSFGIEAKSAYAQVEEVLPYQERLSKEALAKIPGMSEILAKFACAQKDRPPKIKKIGHPFAERSATLWKSARMPLKPYFGRGKWAKEGTYREECSRWRGCETYCGCLN